MRVSEKVTIMYMKDILRFCEKYRLKANRKASAEGSRKIRIITRPSPGNLNAQDLRAQP